MMVSGGVIVGVDGSATAARAVLWAAAEASRRLCPLTIVHAGDTLPTGDGRRRPDEYASRLLVDSEAAVFEAGIDCDVRVVCDEQSPVALLTDLSCTAALVVLGSHGLGQTTAVVLGSVAFRVAAHARCPVTVVPFAPPSARRAEARAVVVGVGSTAASRPVLRFAFEDARRRRVQLRAVRSYFRPDWTTTSASAFYSTGGEFDEAQHELVEGQLAFLRSDFPDVAVSIAVSPHPIGDVLVNEAGTADLLVVGTRFADGHHYSRLGPTTGRVLHRSTVPVTVVGHTYATAAAPEAESSLTGI